MEGTAPVKVAALGSDGIERPCRALIAPVRASEHAMILAGTLDR
jgi:hypothetical protein